VRIRISFPRLLVAAASFFLTTGVIAQTNTALTSPAAGSINAKAAERLEQRPVIEQQRPRLATAAPAIVGPAAPVAPVISLMSRFDKSLLVAIQSHLGATYHFDRTGPDEFDCSGLVWRAFQDVGVNFERGPARSYWATFAVPPKNEEFKFGTLVFFNDLRHVGIVVDDKGFYHSARHGGVMYSPFNEYWLARIDGFRRVPTQLSPLPAAAARIAAKPSVAAATLDQK
jgi:cell wall-associated NlpC family hydrolase